MRWTTPVAVIALLALAGFVAGHIGITHVTQPATTHHVEIVQDGGLGVMAGLVTESETGLAGLTGQDAAPATDGWVVVHAGDGAFGPEASIEVTDRFTFSDPNGGHWEAVEITTATGPAWAVPVGPTLDDPTIDGTYNWVLVVDWEAVDDEDVTVTWVPELAIPATA